DGRAKVGYTAPGGRGQAAVVAEALAVAGVDPETIGYLAAHGTGTQLGDPVEIAALTRAFRRSTAQHGFCALGSLKTNIGHLDAAAGVAGLIKAVLSLRHGELYPSLHFEEPNPEIDFAASPFYVNTRLQPWPRGDTPRRAGVSSFGIGGTNAHAVLEEPPETEPSGPSRPEQILVLSAGTATALEAVTANLRGYLDEHPALSPRELADAAATLALGRRALEHRRMLVVRDPDDARATLAATDSPRVFTRRQKAGDRPVVFMFPGQGAQHVNMGREVYDREPVFRRHVDRGCELLAPHLGVDLRQLLYPAAGAEEEAAERLRQTAITQPALFVVEYALAQLWKEWGIRPEAMIGHSIGEYVAACLAGVMSLEDALALVALRGRLIQETAAGAMLSVPLEPDELPALEERGLSLAAVNAPALCVISGPAEAIDAVVGELAGQGVECRRLKVSHAFHSPLIEPMLEPFAAAVGRVALHPPRIPYLSNLTGTWITAEEAASADYWVRHLRHTVRFADGVAALLEEEGRILLEVGPGRTISSAVRKQPAADAAETLLCSLPHPGEPVAAPTWLFTTLGRLWLAGAAVKWVGYYAGERRCRRELPLYPFERRSYWIAPRRRSVPGETETETKTKMEMEMEMETETEMEMGMGMGMEMEMEMGGHPRPELDVVYVAPRDDLERGIAETWQTFLGLERVGVHDNFFELGGNSLLASQVVARVHESYGVELSMEDFFEANTVADLARAVEAVRREEPAAETPPITPGKEGRL
ncbi:MAG: acyltransferase domain-containing protein, partial [bacterium]|nr:acyltransferase domain-containing protein [bacterium]